MTNIEQIFRSYSGENLEYVLSIVPDLKRMKKVCMENGNPYLTINSSLQKILKHLIRNNVPQNIAQEFVYKE